MTSRLPSAAGKPTLTAAAPITGGSPLISARAASERVPAAASRRPSSLSAAVRGAGPETALTAPARSSARAHSVATASRRSTSSDVSARSTGHPISRLPITVPSPARSGTAASARMLSRERIAAPGANLRSADGLSGQNTSWSRSTAVQSGKGAETARRSCCREIAPAVAAASTARRWS